MLTFSQLSSTAYAKVEQVHANAAQDRLRARYASSIESPYMLDEEEIAIVSTLLKSPVTLKQTGLKRSAHPIASFLNDFACKNLNDEFGTRSIAIGGNRLKEEAGHQCQYITSSREFDRIAHQGDINWKRDFHQDFIDNNIIECRNGTQNCNVECEVLTSVDSLYDITFEQIPDIMRVHNAKYLVAWMFLPLELLDEELMGFIPKKFYKITKLEKDLVAFSFVNDLSFAYVHRINNWRKYLNYTKIEADDFDINIEIRQTIGPYCKLYFTRTPKYNCLNYRPLPFSDYFSDLVKVPNMRIALAEDFLLPYKDIPKFIVPKSVVHNMLSFVTRGPDNSFSYERGATYFHGITSKIVIGSFTYTEDLGKLGYDYDDLLFSLMCLASTARLRRTKNFGDFIRAVDNNFHSNSTSFLKSFEDAFRMKVHDFKKYIFGESRGLKFNVPNSVDFMMYSVECLQTTITSSVCKVTKKRLIDKLLLRKNSINITTSENPVYKNCIDNFISPRPNLNNQNQTIYESLNNTPITSIDSDTISMNSSISEDSIINTEFGNNLNPTIKFDVSLLSSIGSIDDMSVTKSDKISRVIISDARAGIMPTIHESKQDQPVKTSNNSSISSQSSIKIEQISFKDTVSNLRDIIKDINNISNNNNIQNLKQILFAIKNIQDANLVRYNNKRKDEIKKEQEIKDDLQINIKPFNANIHVGPCETNKFLGDIRISEYSNLILSSDNLFCNYTDDKMLDKTDISLQFNKLFNKYKSNITTSDVYNFKVTGIIFVKIDNMHICCINNKLEEPLDTFSKQHYIYLQRIHTYCIKHNLICFLPNFIPYNKSTYIKSFIGVLNKSNISRKITLVVPKEEEIKYFNHDLSFNDSESILSTKSFENELFIPEILDQFNVNSKIISKNEELYQSIKLFERKLISNFKSRGHAKAHFILSKYVKCEKRIIYDIGCAPGYASFVKSKEIYGAHYTGVGAVALKFRNRYKEIIEFTDLDQLKLIPKCNIIYSDIGNEEHTFKDYIKLLRIAENAEYLIFKTFIDHYDHFIKLLHNFENVSIIKPSYSFSINKEIYCICSGLLKQPISRDFTGQLNMILHSLVTTQINYMKKSIPEIHPQQIDDEN